MNPTLLDIALFLSFVPLWYIVMSTFEEWNKPRNRRRRQRKARRAQLRRQLEKQGRLLR